MLRPLLAQLPPRERTILMLRFFCQLTQTQIDEQITCRKCTYSECCAKHGAIYKTVRPGHIN